MLDIEKMLESAVTAYTALRTGRLPTIYFTTTRAHEENVDLSSGFTTERITFWRPHKDHYVIPTAPRDDDAAKLRSGRTIRSGVRQLCSLDPCFGPISGPIGELRSCLAVRRSRLP